MQLQQHYAPVGYYTRGGYLKECVTNSPMMSTCALKFAADWLSANFV